MPRARFFGQFLLERDVITPQALLKALSLQDQVNEPIGTIAVRHGLLTPAEVSALHREQRKSDRRLGELAVSRGMLDPAQTDHLLDEQARAHIRIGEALVRLGAVTRDTLERELAAFTAEKWVAPAPPPGPHSALIERTLRLTQTLFHRLAHVVVKLGGVADAPSESFSHTAIAELGPARLYLAFATPVARKLTCGMLGFEADNLDPADLSASLTEFLSALATQLGGTTPARITPLPSPLPDGARLFELYTADDTIALVFDLR